jgi:hypothetical protein
VLRDLLDWWDGVELWLTQLSFPFQVLLAVLVLLPGCWLAAAGIDRAVDRIVAAVAARRSPRAPEPAEAADEPSSGAELPELPDDAPAVPDTVPDAVSDTVPDRSRPDDRS